MTNRDYRRQMLTAMKWIIEEDYTRFLLDMRHDLDYEEQEYKYHFNGLAKFLFKLDSYKTVGELIEAINNREFEEAGLCPDEDNDFWGDFLGRVAKLVD